MSASSCRKETEELSLNPTERSTFSRQIPQRLFEKLCRVKIYGDIHERATDLGIQLPLGSKRKNRLQQIRAARTLFIHVPKNAGTSISQQLYGRSMRHETARYYFHVAPDLKNPAVSRFAIWRDPVERFLSAYDFARTGGAGLATLHPRFRPLYRQFRSVDDALDHIEQAKSPYELDHVFRPQSWYVCDWNNRLLVDQLIPLTEIPELPKIVPALTGCRIPHLNHTKRTTLRATPHQIDRIRRFYAQDEQLLHAPRTNC
ncbi:sulfotransferase family 2 domain-containing protein [Kozakia baliensis]|uniref:sulfotransferase family 2 domain-containing protein n=1 Tax=Kozakia baliensis TaxID=153496 RepID=UPI000B25AE8D|nr:sulfotransferase family 2 domain-containing protein [Kozakia baliensis]